MMDYRASVYQIMPIFVAPVVPEVGRRYLIRPGTSREQDTSVGL